MSYEHELKQHFHKLESLSLALSIGALHVDVMKLNYVPPGPNWYAPPHKHSSYEFHFITEDKGFGSMGNTPFNVEAGMLYLTGPEVVHTQLTDKTEPMAELCLQCQFEIDAIAYFASQQEARQLLTILSTPVNGAVHDQFGAIPLFFACAKEANNSYVGHYSLIRCLIAEILLLQQGLSEVRS
ncbi:AraC-like protein [Paenibacillus taihuensis]|uniref:AraC-like protein n=1 Tax=Paenibacillus taihuensis TaxID=1156355 RepID=A0A3D9QU89_9BACL|nr:AraC family ligand binding domain-containing protein [Paenibacillus taihuensis]REE66995.1 AraC-like protein [Paenibacillus taihuensis]